MLRAISLKVENLIVEQHLMQGWRSGTTRQTGGYTAPPEKSLPMYLKLKKSQS